jgi:hypothetical protein
MIQDAYLILAMDAVRNRARARNESIVMNVFAEPSNACNIMVAAHDQDPASTLAAGRPFCVDRSVRSAQIYNNIVEQIEYMGLPLSNGGVGEGVRLLLGSDITGLPAVLVNNASDPKNQVRERAERERRKEMYAHTHEHASYSPNKHPTSNKQTTYKTSSVKTRWLLPASLQTFDTRCANNRDVSQADAAGCPAVGTFRSCTFGCNRDPTREARWPRDKYVLGYWGGDWTVAGGAAWEELRGVLTGWMDNDVRMLCLFLAF